MRSTSRLHNVLVLFASGHRMRLLVFLLIFAACRFVDGQEVGQDIGQSGSVVDRYQEAATRRWEGDIAKLEAKDAAETDPAGAVLLIGSSSIRLWENAAEGLAPYPVIQRGYGGARYSDLAVFAERLITPHDYRAIVMFVANDVTGSDQDIATEEIERLVRHILAVAKKHRPEAPVLIVEVTPTPSRWKVWREIREVNVMLRDLALTEPHVYFVATAEHYLDREKQPLAELFREDMLHQNEAGYAIWGSLIRQRLDEVLGQDALLDPSE